MVAPRRLVVQGEALAWMDAVPAEAATSVITSLPDVSEMALPLDRWRAWFIDAVRRVIRWVPRGGVAIFYQTDVRHGGAWIDKGYLVMRAAEEQSATVIFHKIVCRKPPGTIALGRPSYAHMIGVSSAEELGSPRRPGPDVLPAAGFTPWSRGMGAEACRVACRFLRDETTTRTVVDPFCGRGTVLAVANAMGFDAIGVDLGAKRCRAARALVIASAEDPGSDRTARDAFEAGARRFDAGAFWEAHEIWEARWRLETDPIERNFFQGLIQIAAALHQLLILGAPAPASRLLARGLAKLTAFPPDRDLTVFCAAMAACAPAVAESRLDPASIPRLTPLNR